MSAGAFKFPHEVSSLEAEMTGFELALAALLKLSRGYVNIVPHEAEESLRASEFLSSIDHLLSFAGF